MICLCPRSVWNWRNENRINGKKVPLRLHQEDFAQALGITASQKYEKNGKDYLADAFELIKNYI